MNPQPDYGIDAPRAVSVLWGLSSAAFLLATLSYLLLGLPVEVSATLAILGADLSLVAVLMLSYSRRGKLRQRDQLLATVPWKGGEHVLDVGCGRGLLLLAAAQRVPHGKAVGVDIWSNIDLSSNSAEATRENARRAGVADRVEVQDADAQRLPFADAAFDVVVSSLVIHNIPSREGRRQAIREIARVLKPGGRVALLDLRHTSDYVRVLHAGGLSDARRSPVGVLMTWLFPLLTCGAIRFYRVTGSKSA